MDTAKLSLINLGHFALNLPLLVYVAVSLTGAWFIFTLLGRPKKLDLPVFADAVDHRKTLVEGNEKYPNSPFIIETKPPLVILPISLIDEIRNLPEDKASFMQDIRRACHANYTGVGGGTGEVPRAVKIDLTRTMASKLGEIQDEARYSFEAELGSCEGWTAFPVHQKFSRIVALVSGRIFVGSPFSREEAWISATTGYTAMCYQAIGAVGNCSKWTRAIVAPFLSEVRSLWRYKRRGAILLKPMLEEMLAEMKCGEFKNEKGNMISWLLLYTPEKRRSDPIRLGENQMSLSMAAIHTVTLAVTAMIYDLATYPEHVEPLREEIQKVLDADGYNAKGDGILRLKKSSISKLWKLDSFMKESQRLTPPQLPTNVRVATSPITLSTGHTLQPGTRFGFAAYAIHNSTLTPSFSPTLSPPQTLPLSQFDGFRFSKLRGIPGHETRHQFVTTSPDSLNFGHGNHSCPGRFFASNEIKVILIELLRNWDVRFVGDEKCEGGVERRPENAWRGVNCGPNTSAEVEFRRRKL